MYLIRILKIKVTIFILISLFGLSTINVTLFYLFVPGPSLEKNIVIIESKLPIKQISIKLKNHGIIKYPKLFSFLAKIYSLRHPLKSGEYIFTSRISPYQVLNILSTGKSIIHKLVIPEGITVREIVEKINQEERLLGEIKGWIPEGFLMPSTYFYSYGDQKEQLIEQMRKRMSLALDEMMGKLSLDSPIKSRIEVLTLASIVEKEAFLDSERPVIAGVFLNRLKKGMKLQADPTSIYAITEGKYKFDRILTKKDLAFPSEYNTYYTLGLPPGPIACPGIKSLKAVVEHAKTSALYFVVDGKGGHNFASTLQEHNKNIAKYKDMLKFKSEN